MAGLFCLSLEFPVQWGCRGNTIPAQLPVQPWYCCSSCQVVSNEMTQSTVWGPVPGGSTGRAQPEFLQLQHFSIPSSPAPERGVCAISVLWKHWQHLLPSSQPCDRVGTVPLREQPAPHPHPSPAPAFPGALSRICAQGWSGVGVHEWPESQKHSSGQFWSQSVDG